MRKRFLRRRHFDRQLGRIVGAAAALALWPGSPAAQTPQPRLELGALLATAGQCQRIDEGEHADDVCSAALLAQPHLAYRPTRVDEFHVRLGFASSNLLNNRSPLVFAPWAADLEDDVQSVNGTGRDYLLTARYSRRVELSDGARLRLSVGLVDATDYLDENRYANDEFTQFMSAALVNGPNVYVPSYDWGAGAQWRRGRWSVNGVCMRVDGEDGFDTGYCGAQVGFHPETPLGPGNYRLALSRSGSDFPAPSGTSRERRESLILSLDQQLGRTLGAFVRIAVQSDDPAIAVRSTWSTGLDLAGESWGRPDDHLGLGVGYADGGNLQLRRGYGGETFYRLAIRDRWALSGHVQYARNALRGAQNVAAWVFGLRLTVEL